MKKLLLVSLCFLMLFMTQVYAQNRTVTGTVLSKDDGLPLPGVSVRVKGSTLGTQTTVTGKFSLPGVPPNSTLVFSYTGYVPFEKVVPAVGSVDVALEVNNKQLGEVVVTGTLGRKLEEKATGYASTHLTANETNQSAEVNAVQGLAGKVAGLQVTLTNTGINPSVKIQLRGSRSINGNNSALVVVDGVPLPSGDISSLDPNTIESYDVLNGGSAGVLYGSEASNGVIVITTKKGSSTNKPTVTYSNSIQAAMVAYYPQIQTQFGQNGGENVAQGGIDPFSGAFLVVPYENELYGPAYDGHKYQLGAAAGSATGPVNIQTYDYKGNPIKDFYNTGITEQNTLAVSSGNADDYFNLTAGHILIHGITPFETSQRYTAGLKAGKKYGIFKAEYNLTYYNNISHQLGTDYNNQQVDYAIGQFPTDLRIKDFQDPTSTFANPSDFYNGYATNPYWAVYNSPNNSTTNAVLGNIKLTLSPAKYLDISYNLSDNILLSEGKNSKAEVDFNAYSVTDPLGAGNIPQTTKAAGGQILGSVSDSYSTSSRLQSDLILNFHPNLSKDFKTNLLVGNTFYTIHGKNMSTSSNQLAVNGLYNIGFIGGTPTASESESTQNQIAYFADATIGYKDFAFIDGSIRNEQDSRLTSANRSYWYPGVSGSFVFTEAIDALKGNKILSFGKIRAAYSVTAQINASPYNIFNTYNVTGGGFPYGAIGGLSINSTDYTTLVPEKVTEFEVGVELGFLDNLIHGSFTYYKQNNRNQTLGLSVSPTTGFSTILTNVGEMQSSGYEAAITVSPLTKAKNKVGLDLSANLADQESKVISLLNNVPQFNITGNQFAVVGLPYPYVESSILQTDPNGRYIVSTTTGYPARSATTTNPIGRTSPEYILGLTGNVSYKFINLSVTAEYRTGFVSDYSGIAASYTFTGSSAYTTQAGRQPFIFPNSSYLNSAGVYVPNTTISTLDGNDKFFAGTSQLQGTGGVFITSGAFWKIREANLGFNLNQFIKNYKWIKGLKFSLTGRNLFIWTPKTNFWGDPEAGTSTGNGGQSPTISQVPGQRVFGAKLDVTF